MGSVLPLNMKGLGLFLCLVGFAAADLDSADDTIPGHLGQPRIEVSQSRSPRGIPSIAVTFANGVKDSLVLERFYPTEQSRMERKLSCNFFGRLENENTACVSVTGCPGEEMAFTINSKNSVNVVGYILHKDGHLELVESAFKDSRVTSGTARVLDSQRADGFHLKGDDEMVNDAEVADEMKFEKLCASGNCNSMPSKQKMQIKIHYDSTFNADTSEVTTYLDGMVTHLQTHFCQISLGTQIQIEAIDGYSYESGQSWTAESSSGSLRGPIKAITAASNSNADLHVFLCKDPELYGVIGLAWVGTMCKTSWAGYNAGVNEKRESVLATSEVVAHEMGHNMGMLHDFDEDHGGSNGPCDGTGIMSYGSTPNVWSTCSRSDFLALYNQIMASSSWNWCLTNDNTACGGTPPGPTTAPPPPTPSTGCESPQWANDQWCDDENNNADCNYDGGACCNNNVSGWDEYCSDCECLDSNATGPTPAPCDDMWKAKKCKKMKKKGKCGKPK